MMAPDQANGFRSTSSPLSFPDFVNDPEIQRLVTLQARRLSRFSANRGLDQKDFEQALYLHLLDGLRRLDFQVGNPAALANTILKRRSATLIRDSRAAKRYCKGIKSLSECPPGPSKLSSKNAPLDQDDRVRHHGAVARSSLDIASARMDLELALNDLSPKLRRLAELLQTFTPTEAAGILNRPRTSVQADIKKIRRRFEKRGLQKYFD